MKPVPPVTERLILPPVPVTIERESIFLVEMLPPPVVERESAPAFPEEE